MEKKKKINATDKINTFYLIPNSMKKKKAQPDAIGYGRDENGRRFRLVGWKNEMKGKHVGETFIGGNLNYLDEKYQNDNHLINPEDEPDFDVNDL